MRPLDTTARKLTAKQMNKVCVCPIMERGGTSCAHALCTSRDLPWRMSGNLLVVIVEVDSDAQELQQVTAPCFGNVVHL